jgi:hypothetical protein
VAAPTRTAEAHRIRALRPPRELVDAWRPLTGGGRRRPSAEDAREFADWVARTIAPRNVAGLADPGRRNLYPVDLEALIEGSHRLGLTASDVRRALPRFRG